MQSGQLLQADAPAVGEDTGELQLHHSTKAESCIWCGWCHSCGEYMRLYVFLYQEWLLKSTWIQNGLIYFLNTCTWSHYSRHSYDLIYKNVGLVSERLHRWGKIILTINISFEWSALHYFPHIFIHLKIHHITLDECFVSDRFFYLNFIYTIYLTMKYFLYSCKVQHLSPSSCSKPMFFFSFAEHILKNVDSSHWLP